MSIDKVEKALAEQGLKTRRTRLTPDQGLEFELVTADPPGNFDLGFLNFYPSGYANEVYLRTWGEREACLRLAPVFLDLGFDHIHLCDEQPCTGGEW